MRAFLFPGQGSLQPRMGVPWLGTSAWAVVARLAPTLGPDLEDLLVGADQDTLVATANAQRATFALSLVVLDAVRTAGLDAGAYAGHSLGEYTALVAAGAIPEAAGAALVAERAAAMDHACRAQPGTMAAVLGLEPDEVAKACADAGGEAWVANDNAPGQVVIAGTAAGVTAAGQAATARGATRVMPLAVGGAFHSPLMAPAQARLDAVLDEAPFAPSHPPVVANVDAGVHRDGAWKTLLSAQLCQPVQWRSSLITLAASGVDDFVELGPGSALTGMVKRTVGSAARASAGTPDEVARLASS